MSYYNTLWPYSYGTLNSGYGYPSSNLITYSSPSITSDDNIISSIDTYLPYFGGICRRTIPITVNVPVQAYSSREIGSYIEREVEKRLESRVKRAVKKALQEMLKEQEDSDSDDSIHDKVHPEPNSEKPKNTDNDFEIEECEDDTPPVKKNPNALDLLFDDFPETLKEFRKSQCK